MQLYPLLIAFAPIVMAFNFTGPDFDSKVNLSSPVVISWTSSGDSNLPLFDLFFHGDLAGSGGSFMYKLETNLTQSKTGNFTWDPTAVTKALAAAENRLSTEDDFYFEAKEHPLNGTGVVSSTLSESFAVEGYEHMGESSSASNPRMNGILVGGMVVAVLACLN
ncbi:hypothetical protein B0T10DRAFT_483843 [Thelonectria olida]|uniref:Uncharacterized protein n=1 Tax=Thelonectria olida TaxID=1576542 RepID=A0A9P9AUC8_9HYPO|nr:hypothetical protein B0T10DRAFT_483843 [Thelonectria olida]